MSRLFLSYRRADCPDTVKLLYERLKARLPRWQVFYDHYSIVPGEPFPQRLRDEVSSAEVVLVIIGPQWVRSLQERRSVAVDHVREEIKLAIETKRKVIPLLVQNATGPSDTDLIDFPELTVLPSLNHKLLRPEPDFDTDLDKLVAFLEPLGPSIDVGTVLDNNFKLVELIGEGGMGLVYKAHQLQPKRDVAVKLIKPGMDSREVLARFAAERQALAMMNHPHIAKVLEAGTSPSGRPFFVMELVKGVPITQYCDDKKLTPNQRLLLMQKVCDAVQHAHQKGIIHRDIKPSNVLVETVDVLPMPKVIDFGLAKALNYKLTDASGAVTQAHSVVGTLLYSSPEQAAGKANDIDTRTDIYSLGALLYELLVGEPPFTEAELNAVGHMAMQKRIIEKEPSKPSAKLSSSNSLPSIAANRLLDPAKLTRQVKGELDWIVMKALEKEPSHRYASATSLSEDINHYLNQEPISAGRPSPYYHAYKFIKRHRFPVIAGCGVFVALVLGIIGTTLGFFSAKEAEGRAEKNANDAKLAAKIAAERETEALKEKFRAESQLLRAEKLVYANRVQAAQRYWEVGNDRAAWRSLHSCRWDYRGWEHNYLNTSFQHGYVTISGHSNSVSSVAFSPDGQRIASGSVDKTVKVWDASTGKELYSLIGHNDAVSCVAYSLNHKYIGSGSRDNSVIIWNALNGTKQCVISGLKSRVSSISFSPDCKYIAIACSELYKGDINVFDIISGKVTTKVQLWHDSVYSVDYNCTGDKLLTSHVYNRINVWNTGNGRLIRSLEGHPGNVTKAVFSPDGKYILSGSNDGTICLWDASKGIMLRKLSGHSKPIKSVAFSLDGSRIVSGCEDAIRVWSTRDGTQRSIFQIHRYGEHNATFSPDGKRIAFGDSSNIQVLDATIQFPQSPFVTRDTEIDCAVYSPDDREIALGVGDDIEVLKAATGIVKFRLTGHTRISSLSYSRNGQWILSRGYDETMRIWDAKSGMLIGIIPINHSFDCVAFSPQGDNLVTAEKDFSLKVWDIKSGKCKNILKGHTDLVQCLSFSADGKSIASGGYDHLIYVWDTDSGQRRLKLEGHSNTIYCMAFSYDGIYLISGSMDDTSSVWNTTTGELLHTLRGHTSVVSSVAVSPDSSRIATCSWDNTLKLWDTITGNEVLSLNKHTDHVNTVAFSHSGHSIITSCKDKTLRLWDATYSVDKYYLENDDYYYGELSKYTFSSNGKYICAIDKKGACCNWNSSTGQLTDDKTDYIVSPSILKSTDGKMKLVLRDTYVFLERASLRGPDGLSPKERQDREYLAQLTMWNPSWHEKNATEAEKAENWFTAAFHLRLLVKHAPSNAPLKERLKAVEAKLQ